MPNYEDPYAAVKLTVPEPKKVDTTGKGVAGNWVNLADRVTEGAREVKLDKLVPNRNIKKGTPIAMYVNGEKVSTFYVNGTVVKDGKLPMDLTKSQAATFAVDHKAIKDSVYDGGRNNMYIDFAGDKWVHPISTKPNVATVKSAKVKASSTTNDHQFKGDPIIAEIQFDQPTKFKTRVATMAGAPLAGTEQSHEAKDKAAHDYTIVADKPGKLVKHWKWENYKVQVQAEGGEWVDAQPPVEIKIYATGRGGGAKKGPPVARRR